MILEMILDRKISDAIERFGSRVLDATDLEDLEERINKVIDDPDYENVNPFIAVVFINDVLMRTELDSIVGIEQLVVVDESRDLVDELTGHLTIYIDSVNGERIVPSILVNDKVPVPIRQVFLAMYQSSVASLGLAETVHHKRVLDTWISRTLCERIRDGLKQFVTLVASLPGATVPESVVPSAERMDIASIYEQHRISRAKADEDFARHRANGD